MRLQHQRMHRDVLARAPAPALITTNGIVESIVYVTAQPTFTGVIGGYTTLTPDNSSPTQAPQPSQEQSAGPDAATASQAQQTQSGGYRLSLQSSATASPTAISTSSSPIQLSPSSSDNGFTSSSPTGASSGASETQSTSASSSSGGSSLGGKIGLAVGIISAIGIIAILLLFFIGRKKRQQRDQEQMESEKREQYKSPAVTQAPTPPSPEAPRLSLRPVSSLVPEFMGGPKPRNRLSQGNMLNNMGETGRTRNMMPPSQPIALVERPRPAENPFKDPENPFLDPEKATGPWTAENNVPVSPVSTNAPNHAPSVAISELTMDNRQPEPTAESFPIPQVSNHNSPVQPAAPAPTSRSAYTGASPGVTYAELPGAPAPAPIIAPGPGPDGPQSNVYRILMDFRPTMEDELELRAGQLVRMLHEYDDGWALCIRLDRSQQGVVPRTCLAAKPSKPRPGPPPAGPNSRPITPQGRPRGPPGPPGPGMGNPRLQGPAPIRSQSPATVPSNAGAFNQPPRPLSPGPRPQPPPQKRSMSPGPYAAGGPKPMGPAEQKRRSNSVGAVNVRNKRESPPGPSKLGPGLPPVTPDSPGLAL